MQVKGRVFDQDSGQGISGVHVSDGEQIVESDGDGVYVLDLDETAHAFVWITIPEAYKTQDDFFAVCRRPSISLIFPWCRHRNAGTAPSAWRRLPIPTWYWRPTG